MAVNPDFNLWMKSDRLLRRWITGTLLKEVLGLVVELDTVVKVWKALIYSFAQAFQERKFYLEQKLRMHRKGNSSLTDYIQTFKRICDDLVANGKPITNCNKVFSLLIGLGASYELFVTTMLKPPTPSYIEVIPLLQSHETI